MKILKKLSKPILMLLLICTCVFTNMAYAIRKEFADVEICGRKQYTLFWDKDEKGYFTELVDNFGKSLLRITLEYDVDATVKSKGRYRCIEYGTREENVLIRKYKSKDDFQNLYIAKGEFSGNRVFSIIDDRTPFNPDKHGVYIRQSGKPFKVSPDTVSYDVGDEMLAYGNTRIVRTSQEDLEYVADPCIAAIVYGMLHQ